MRVTLATKSRKKPTVPIEAESIIPQHFLNGSELTVYEGNKERNLEEIFYITIEGPAVVPNDVEVVLRGDTGRIKRVGEYMAAGRIIIEGDIGMHCGNFMSGGEILIEGNADAWLGREMREGRILCSGNAGHYCAAGYRGEKRGMRGGMIEVKGNTGDYTGEFLSGGTVHIHGNAGDMAGVEMRGGTLIIEGECTRPCGNMTAGTAKLYGKVHQMLPTFRFQDMQQEQFGGENVKMRIFRGDVANRGKGTLLIRDSGDFR
jgi:formylmethanofuran dehydrogenase subunit C